MAPLALLAGLFTWLGAVPAWLALAVVFVMPALEASVFLGIVVPGEIAVVMGGAVAAQGHLPLAAAVVAAIGGAVVGDSVGYFVGRRWGQRLLSGVAGRLARGDRVERTKRYLRDHPASTILLGRFTAALRALVPGLAGMSHVRYGSFVVWNVLGGALWAGGFAVLGYVAGRNWRRVEHLGSVAGLVLLAVVAVIVVRHVRRKGRGAGADPARHRATSGA